MTGSPPARPEFQTAPPIKRANPDGIPVRLYDGSLVAHVSQELGDRLMAAGAADPFRRGPRRYLRLREGIRISRSARGWEVIEFLRRSLGDKKAADYVAHKDCECETLRYQPPGRDRKVK